MKSKTKAASQNRQGIKDALSEVYCTSFTPPQEGTGGGLHTPPLKGTGGGFFTPPLERQGGGPQNKGKGPPGRARSPGAGICRNPDNKAGPPWVSKTLYNTKYQIISKYQKTIFITINFYNN